MANKVFPEIIYQDDRWFLTGFSDKFPVKVELPNYPMMNRIWEASSDLLEMYVDDTGGNEYNIELLRKVSKAFSGISQLLSNQADKEQEQLDLDRLYAFDPDEPWYNK